MAQLKDLIVTGPARFVGTVYAGNGFNGNLVGNVTGNLTGVASTASKLATARTIALSGSVTGSGSFDGSGNLTITTTTNHTHNYAGSSSAGGVANSAAKLATARTISLTGAVTGSGSFDGSGNLSITTAKNHTHTAAEVGADPKGTAATLISNLINGAPETLDTLKEIADVITTNKSAIDTLNAAIAKKAEKTDLTNHINNTSGVHPVATTSALGFMSAADKKKLDGIASGANAYSHPTHTAYSSGLYKITVNSLGHVTAATAVAKADITALGIPGSDTNTWRGIQNNLTSDSTTDSLSAAQGKVLKGLVDGKAASSHTHSYLPLAGGTMASGAQIIRAGYSTSWIGGRSRALLRMNTIDGYSPAISIKTTNGSWDIGAYDNSSHTDKLVFTYCTDANFNAGNNSTTAQITFNSDGSIGGAIPWSNVTGKPSSFTPASHTHNYAGSSSAGGSATSAVKLDTATAGSATQPVYWTGGKPAACTYTLGKSVPSNAIFTDTKVTQTAITASDYTNWRPLIWGASNSGTEGFTPSTVTDGVYTASTLSCQPSSGTIRATKFKGNLEGNATSASSVAWGNVSGKPSTFTPSSHTHSYLVGTANSASSLNTKTSTGYFHYKYNVNVGTEGLFDAANNANAVFHFNKHDGNYDSQLGFSNNGRIYYRSCNGESLGSKSWFTLAYTSDLTWSNVSGKPSSFTPASHTHNYAGSSSAGGAANSLSYFKNTSTTNVGIDDTSANAIGYVSGTSGIMSQSDGAMYKQVYNASWVHEIYGDYRTGQLAVRGKNNGTWQAWRKILDSSNYTGYTVTKTGSGASGTWGINVTGSAGSVAWSNVSGKPSTFPPSSHTHDYAAVFHNHQVLTGWSDTRDRATAPNDYNKNHGVFEVVGIKTASVTGISDGTYSTLVGIRGWGDSSGGNAHELAFGGSGGLFHRHGSTDTWGSWSRILESSNYTSYTVKKDGTGASGTWGINVTGSAGSVAWSNVSGKPSTFTPASHKHTKSDIKDFPTSMPASDVYAWAKASTKPTYTASEVGAAAASHTHSGYAASSHSHTYTFDVSIVVADWATNSNGGYKCTKTVSGILATDEIFADVSLSSDVSAAKLQIAAWACVCNGNIFNSANNTVDFYCYDTKPAAALTIRLTVVR